MRNKTILTLLIILVCFIPSAHAARIWVEPAYLEVSEGANFTVDITVDPEGEEVMGAQYFLHFNNTLLNAIEQIPGTFLSHDGADTWVKNRINNTIGVIEYGETRLEVTYGVTDLGVLASVTFNVTGERGVSELNLTDIILSNVSACEMDVNITDGSVEIKSGICGDVNCQDGVDMADAIQIAMGTIYGTGAYPLADPWAADVNCEDGVDMADAIQIAMGTIYGAGAYPLECC